MRSLGLLPALVTMENSTALPALSNSAPFCRWKPSALQALQRGVGAIRLGLEFAVEPELIGGRNRADGGLGVTVEDHAAEIVAIDGLEKSRAGNWLERNQARLYSGMGAFATWLNHMKSESSDGPASCASPRRTGGQAVEVIAVDDVDQVEFAALEAQHLNVAIRLNVEPDGIEIGQAASLGIFFPVVGIAAQQHA